MTLPIRGVVILGAGGLGREVLWALGHVDSVVTDSSGTAYTPEILGVLDDETSNHGNLVNGTRVLGGSDWLEHNPDALVVMAIGIPTARRAVVESMRHKSVNWASFASPHSVIGAHSRVGEGSIVLPGAVVTVNVQLGRFVLLNPSTSVSHDCVIGDFTSIGPGASLAGNVDIGSCCDVGTNASVIPAVKVGDSTVVGAGACVVRDLPAHVTAVGVPAKVVDRSASLHP